MFVYEPLLKRRLFVSKFKFEERSNKLFVDPFNVDIA